MAPSVSFGRLHWMHWSAIALSVLLTITAWSVSNSNAEQKNNQYFEFLANQLLIKITDRMTRYEDALHTGVVAIHTQDGKVDAESWKRFSEALKLAPMYSGINSIGVILYVPKDNVYSFLKNQRLLRPDFKIYPSHAGGEYWPITYLEPKKDNEPAIGLDITFEENRFSAAKQARDTSETHITKPIILVQDSKKTPGFLQFLPFYNSSDITTLEQRRKHFVGHVYAPFIMESLIAGIFDKEDRQLIFSIYDGEKALYNELHDDNSHYSSTPIYSKKTSLKMYNRSWEFTIQTSTSFSNSITANQSTYILIVGAFVNILLALLVFMLSSSNKRSLVLVDEMTKKVITGEEYFRHVIDAAPCGMIITDDNGIIENVNPQVEVLFGYDKKELLGQSIDILVPQRFRHAHSKNRDVFYQNQSQRRMGIDRNVYGLKRSGEEFPAEIGLANFKGEGGFKILSTVINISQNVAITDELKRSNKDLNDFAYVASHDLKAPLRGIMQLASWIEEDIADTVSDETKNHLALLQGRTARLEKLLDDLLTYSRIGHHPGEIEEVDLNEMVRSLFNLLDPPAGFSLIIADSLPVLRTLITPLEVIFRNIISNAIKHHDKSNGIISISATEYETYYQFSVSNDGPGIDPKHHQQIFEMFKTLRPRDEVEGSGMGLAVIKKMLDYHGKKISVSSNGNRGVEFIFSWPKNFTDKV